MANPSQNNRQQLIENLVISDDILCRGVRCARRNNCVRYSRWRNFASSKSIFNPTLCEWDGDVFLNMYIPLEQVDATLPEDDFGEGECVDQEFAI